MSATPFPRLRLGERVVDVRDRVVGRVVLITGAASGIRRETALRAASEGADIAAIDLNRDALDSLVEEIRAMERRAEARGADVSDAL